MRQGERPRNRRFDSDDGIEWACCRICGDELRVISNRHLGKHDTDRETYMKEYHLTPDELIAKAFRTIQSSRQAYYPNGKNDGSLPSRRCTNGRARCLPDISKNSTHIYMSKAFGFSVIGIRLCLQRDLMRMRGARHEEKIIKKMTRCRLSGHRFMLRFRFSLLLPKD